MTPVIATLPSQQKLVLASILLNEQNGLRNVQTGEVYDIYRQACKHIRQNPLTQRRISGLISNLDMLGLVTARTVSKGRYGRSKEIDSCIPGNVNVREIMSTAEEDMRTVFNATYHHQASFLEGRMTPTGLWFGVLKCSSRFARTMSDDDAGQATAQRVPASRPVWCSSVSGDWSSQS